MSRTTRKWLWLVVGAAAAGAATALLYAPQSGRETRRYLARKSRKAREVLADTGEDIVEHGRGIYKKGARLAEDATDLLERGRKLMVS